MNDSWREGLLGQMGAMIALGAVAVDPSRLDHRGDLPPLRAFNHIEPKKDRRAKVKSARRQNVRRMQK